MFYNKGDCDRNNETGLKEGGVIEMSTTVLPLRDARSFALNTYLSYSVNEMLQLERHVVNPE